jgi:hypothetical protein
MKKLRHIINLALKNEWIDKNPFKDDKLQWQKADRGYLAQEEVETLMDCQLPDKQLEKTRDTFIFCCFTGLSYTDIKSLTSENIQPSFDGRLWIKGQRNKTDTDYNIPILNMPSIIMEKYRGETVNNRILPVPCISTYNKELKKIAALCGFEKKVTSHLARHTFATTITLSKGVPIETVSKMLGHTNLRTTQIYARILNSKISDDMAELAGKMKKLDMKLEFSGQHVASLESFTGTLNIPSGRAADAIWENLTTKVWNKLSNMEKQAFMSDVESKESKPKTFRDFYIILMDYFLDNLTEQSDNFTHKENGVVNE